MIQTQQANLLVRVFELFGGECRQSGMVAFVQNAERHFAHVHVRVKRRREQNGLELGRQWLVVWKHTAERTDRHFTMNNFPGVPRRQQRGARIGGLLDHVSDRFGIRRVIRKRRLIANQFLQWSAEKPNANYNGETKAKQQAARHPALVGMPPARTAVVPGMPVG